MNLLSTLLDILSRTDIDELTQRFEELFNAAASVLNPGEQAIAKEALRDRRADNDEGHARLQEKLRNAAQG